MFSMSFKFKHANRIVGIFVFTALAMLIGTLVLVAIQQKVFVKKYIFQARFLDAEGLSGSTPINFKGYEIGRIVSFRLNEENLIDAEFYVVEEYRDKIVENSALNKAKNPITGASSIELLQGPDLKKTLPEGSLIPAIDIAEGRFLIDEGLVIKTGDPISSMVVNLDQFLFNLNRDNNTKSGAIFRAMVNLANAAERLDVTLSEVSVMIEKMNRNYQPGDGQLFAAIHEITRLARQVEGLSSQLNTTLVNTDKLLVNYQNPDGLAARMIDPTGNQLIEPASTLVQSLNTSISELNKLLIFVNERQPELGAVISDGQSALKTARQTMEGVNNNPLIRGGISPSEKKDPEGQPQRPRHQEP